MAFDDDAALATGDIIDALGDSASYCLQGGGPIAQVTGVFDRRPIFIELEDGSVQQFTARFSAKTSELPVGADTGDQIIVGTTTYAIHTLEPDNLGNTDLMLGRV